MKMKRFFMLLIAVSLLFTSCSEEKINPLMEKWDTPFETPPFNKINTEHHLPAFNEAIKIHNSEKGSPNFQINAIPNLCLLKEVREVKGLYIEPLEIQMDDYYYMEYLEWFKQGIRRK